VRTRSVLASGLQTVVNNVLSLDAELAEGIAELEELVLEVHVQGIDQRWHVHFSDAGVRILPVDEHDSAPEPDVRITGPAFTLLRLLGRLDSVGGVLPPGVSISGDLQCVQKLTRLARRANIDWEEPLAKLFGDSVAHELGRGIRGFAAWARKAGETIAGDMGEYLREERRLTPTRLEVDDFAVYVDQIRDDVERLEARVDRLARRVRER
jgi:ubiquinone biosynthesis accessory factor UbiJ